MSQQNWINSRTIITRKNATLLGIPLKNTQDLLRALQSSGIEIFIAPKLVDSNSGIKVKSQENPDSMRSANSQALPERRSDDQPSRTEVRFRLISDSSESKIWSKDLTLQVKRNFVDKGHSISSLIRCADIQLVEDGCVRGKFTQYLGTVLRIECTATPIRGVLVMSSLNFSKAKTLMGSGQIYTDLRLILEQLNLLPCAVYKLAKDTLTYVLTM